MSLSQSSISRTKFVPKLTNEKVFTVDDPQIHVNCVAAFTKHVEIPKFIGNLINPVRLAKDLLHGSRI